jgi:hypothetical protein
MTMFTDQDIFITNTTSTYQDIPKDCKLVGAELDHPDSIYLNLTDSGSFWVGALKGSKRNISPFGELLIIHTIGISCVITCLLLCYYIKYMCHSIVILYWRPCIYIAKGINVQINAANIFMRV